MSANKNHIDTLIKQKLDGHKVKAPEQSWSRLNADLHAPGRSGFFWISRSAAAVILLLIAFGAGYYFSEFNRSENNNLAENTRSDKFITQVDKEAHEQDVESQNPAEEPAADTQEVLTAEEPVEESKTENSFFVQPNDIVPQIDNTESSKVAENIPKKILHEEQADANNLTQEGTAPSENPETTTTLTEMQENTKPVVEQEKISIPKDEVPVMSDEMLHEMLLSGQDDLAAGFSGKKDRKAISKWSIGGRLSPVYSYRNLSGDAFETPDESVNAGYFDSNEQGITTIAGGISLDYQFNKRLSLGSGMYLSRIGQQNNDVLVYNDPQTSDMFKLATSSGTVTINPANFESVIADQPASPKDSIPGDYIVGGSFVQNLDYLEVPLVLKYKVIDNKLSVNVLGGLSPGILVNNRSYFSVEGQKLQTGTTENIEHFIYNSIVGLGLEYAISKKLAFSMEPSFKYSLSPVNSRSDLRYHPYSLSVFTGISYRLD